MKCSVKPYSNLSTAVLSFVKKATLAFKRICNIYIFNILYLTHYIFGCRYVTHVALQFIIGDYYIHICQFWVNIVSQTFLSEYVYDSSLLVLLLQWPSTKVI